MKLIKQAGQNIEKLYNRSSTAHKKYVEEKVRGTFGGQFKHFGNGKFSYVAYTD